MLAVSISKNSFILGIFALITAGLLALTQVSTKDRIAEQERRAAQKALFELVPKSRHNNDILTDTLALTESLISALNLKDNAQAHIARQDGQPVAIILPSTAPDGYSGDIKLLVGINMDGSLAGVRVLSHTETPGLGDKIDLKKSDWILSFNGKSLRNPNKSGWAVKKDGGEFDQFTGATITPRAIVNQVRTTLALFSTLDIPSASRIENASSETSADTSLETNDTGAKQ